MKVLSDDILHKTDLGCVCLGIHSVEGMHEAYETILENARKNAPSARVQGVVVQQMLPKGFEVLLGVSTDPQFGQVLMVGLGGIYVELLKAVSMRMVPISRGEKVFVPLAELEETVKKLLDAVHDNMYAMALKNRGSRQGLPRKQPPRD